MDRRDFLTGSLSLTAAALIPRLASASPLRRGVVVGAFKGLDTRTHQHVYALMQVDLDSGKRRPIPLDFLFHGFAVDPRNTHRAVLFEKKGPGAGEVDLVQGRFLRPLHTVPERVFYGHGTFSHDGRVLFAAETELKSSRGVVAIRDGKTLAPMGEFPSYGQAPHDCLLVDGGRTLVVTNGGGPLPDGDAPSVCFIDVKSHKLLERLTPSSKHVNAGHVALSAHREVAVVSAPRDGQGTLGMGAISLGVRGQDLLTMSEPAEVVEAMRGETLSLSVHDGSHRVGATNPTGNQLSFWDLRTRTLVKALQMENPRGLTQTLDGQYFVVSHGATADLALLSTRTLEQEPKLAVEQTGIAGSHLYTWAGRVE